MITFLVMTKIEGLEKYCILRSNFVILTLFSSRKQFNQSEVCERGTQRSVEGMSTSRTNNRSASLRPELDPVGNHPNWNGYPLLYVCKGVHSAANTPVQLVPTVFGLGLNRGDMEAREDSARFCWRDTVRCGALHGV